MSDIIGVDAAKLAGLQIDLLSKYRDGSLDLDSLAWWLNLSRASRDAVMQTERERFLAAKGTPAEKFDLLVDLGVITVPENFESSVEWAGLHFSNPSRVLKPGDKLLARAYWQTVPGSTTSQERMAFLERREEGNVYLGAQGALLVDEQKRDQLPKGFWYASFDHVENLPASGDHLGVPIVDAYSDGGFCRCLGFLDVARHVLNAFLGFSDLVESPLGA